MFWWVKSRQARPRLRPAALAVVVLASGLAACAGPPAGVPPQATLPPAPPAIAPDPPIPMASFTELGLASWYGARFHRKRTASGEAFDADALTAAHPSLRLDTVARVTNLGNRRTVLVRINDRGPFAGRRIIDLSRGAAERLGMTRAGVAKVRVEVFDEDQRAVVAQTAAPLD